MGERAFVGVLLMNEQTREGFDDCQGEEKHDGFDALSVGGEQIGPPPDQTLAVHQLLHSLDNMQERLSEIELRILVESFEG
jgi:hypothetical protein